jgi:hypothetical protein
MSFTARRKDGPLKRGRQGRGCRIVVPEDRAEEEAMGLGR